MLKSKFSFLLLAVASLTWWGCSSVSETSRYPAGTMDAGIIGPKGEVVLFYKDDGKIIIKHCEDYTNLQSRDDCKLKPGTSAAQVDAERFKSSFKMALKIPGGNYDADTKRKIELYNNGKRDDIEELRKKQSELKSKVAKIEAFIAAFGEENADTEFLAGLRSDLTRVEGELGDYSQLSEIIKEINGKIDNLVDKIISSPELFKYTFSKQKTGFVYNILKSYLRTPMISASFQRITKGSFTMGSPSSESNRSSDENQRYVTISKSFDVMTTEVTQMQWFLVMGTNPSRFKNPENCNNHININDQGICPSNPVERVSWNDVKEFIGKLNEGLEIKGCTGSPRDPKGCYRLPTEAEWEYAARGKKATAYSFGNSSEKPGSYAWYNDNSESKTHPVGLKRANPYGLYDVHGNVWEWVQDKYKDTLKGGTDPLHSSSGSYRVIRGGGWISSARYLRSAFRGSDTPVNWGSHVGFRLVRTL